MKQPVDVPSRSDWFVAGLSQLIGGPHGDHVARRKRFWRAGHIVLALTCLTLALHWVQKSPCRNPADWVELQQYTRFCYSDVIALYGAEGGLSTGGLPYLDYPLEYPVLTGVFMALIGVPVHVLGQTYHGVVEHTWFYDGSALVLSVLAVASVAMMLSLRQRRPWDIAMFALAPALLVTATVNWDLLAVAFAVGGLFAWARGRPLVAGVLLGLGTAAKLWPGFLFVPLIVLGWRTRRHRQVWGAVGVGVTAWVAVNLPVMIADYLRNGSLDNWGRFLQLNTERAVDWGTFWYIGRYLEGPWFTGYPGDQGPFQWLATHVDPHLNLLSYLLFGLACLGIGYVALRAPRPPRVAALGFLTVAAFLLFAKVWSQQFVLWLLPLVVLARPRWGAFVAWQVAEVGYFLIFYVRLIVAETGRDIMPEGVFVLAATLRWVTVMALCVLVIRDIFRPDQDPVRQSVGGGDPDAGPLAESDPPTEEPQRWKTSTPSISSRVTPNSSPVA